MNKVLLLGNLGADPELRMTPSGQAVLNFRIATTETWLDKNQAKQERTEWHRVVIWGKRAEALAPRLAKGMKVIVEGRLQTSSYEKDGVKRYSTEVVATDFWFASSGGARSGNGALPRGPQSAEPDAVDIPF